MFRSASRLHKIRRTNSCRSFKRPAQVRLEELESRLAPAGAFTFHDVLTGDFNGDGRQDIAGRTDNGQWWVSVSTGSSFNNQLWTTWNEAAGWRDVIAGDFNNDGKTDIAGMTSSGQWWVALSNGSSFTNSLWATWSPNVTWVDVKTGDFDGDGKIDIAGRILQSGQWWTAISNGSSFTSTLWATWSPQVTWVDVKAADFTGDGKTDIAARVLQSGQWWTAVSNGLSFTSSLWAVWNSSVTWADVSAGDFNGDSKADITGRILQTGQWWTALSTGSSFVTSLWASWNPGLTWADVRVGDFNGDGKADIAGRILQSGQWWVGLSSGASFTTTLWTTWSPAISWLDIASADVNMDGKADLVGRVGANGQWWVALSNGSSFVNQFWTTWSFVATADQDFISQEFLDLLGRPVTSNELVAWTNLLSQGASHTQQVLGLEASQEYRIDEVNFLYEHLLSRMPLPFELSNGVSFLMNGGLFETLEASLVGSTEFFQKSGGTINGFLNAAYKDLLDRSPDPVGLNSWSSILSQGFSRVSFASLIIGGPEYATLQVNQDFQKYLRRQASAAELSVFTPIQQQDGQDIVIALILGSPEYAAMAEANPQAPIPTVTSVSPTSGAVGASVIFSGSFLLNSAVTFNGVSASVTVSSDGKTATAIVPVGATDGPVTLTTPFSAMFGSYSTPFKVLPRITGFNPGSGAVFSQVIITGNNFTGATRVTINGTAVPSNQFTVNSDTQITATVPQGAPTSSGPITVTTPDGTATSSTDFTVTAAGSPTISSFTPDHPTGSPVTITGMTFVQGTTTVTFNGVSATILTFSADGKTMTVTAPSSTTGFITVANGTKSSSSSQLFFYAPTISTVTPTSGTEGSSVHITGTNLLGVTTTFGGNVQASLDGGHTSTNNDLYVIVPTGAVTGAITVSNSAGSATSGTFTVKPPAPKITSISTASIDLASFTISGMNFVSGTSVKFTGISTATNGIVMNNVAISINGAGTQITVLMTDFSTAFHNAGGTLDNLASNNKAPAVGPASFTLQVTTSGGTDSMNFTLAADEDGDFNTGMGGDDF